MTRSITASNSDTELPVRSRVEAPMTQLGKYQLLARLGAGGQAEVFLACAQGPIGFNKLVVVKRLLASLFDDPNAKEMFLDEARLAARLNHPNVVQTYEVGVYDDALFFTMEYLDGQPLDKIRKATLKTGVSGDRIHPTIWARIISEALSGLHYAHTLCDYDGTPLNIVHRDISPHNIFVTYEGQVKIFDFGVAKASRREANKTEIGVVKGKPSYMAPEQLTDSEIDPRTDVFAMGIVLWELLAQKRLMAGGTIEQTFFSIVTKPIPRISELIPDIDPMLDDIVAKSLQRDPALRFQSAQEMREALEHYIEKSNRGVRDEELGQLITSYFKNVREEFQRRVQAYMGELKASPLKPRSLLNLNQPQLVSRSHTQDHSNTHSELALRASGTPEILRRGISSTVLSGVDPSASVTIQPESTRQKKWMSIVASAGVVVIFAMIALWKLNSRTAPIPTSTAEPMNTDKTKTSVPLQPATDLSRVQVPLPSATVSVNSNAAPTTSLGATNNESAAVVPTVRKSTHNTSRQRTNSQETQPIVEDPIPVQPVVAPNSPQDPAPPSDTQTTPKGRKIRKTLD